MKIINQTTEEMVLKEGSQISNIISGLFFILAGSYFTYTIFSSGTVEWVILVPIIFALSGLLWLLLSAVVTISIQKTPGSIRYEKKRLTGTTVNTYNISDIVRVELRKQWQTERDTSARENTTATRQVLVSQTVVVFKDGAELPFGRTKSSSGMSGGFSVLMGGQGKEMAFANQVAQFLSVPFQEIAPNQGSIKIDLGSIGKIQL